MPEKPCSATGPLPRSRHAELRIEMCHQSRMWRTFPSTALRTRFGKGWFPVRNYRDGLFVTPTESPQVLAKLAGRRQDRLFGTKPKRRHLSWLSILANHNIEVSLLVFRPASDMRTVQENRQPRRPLRRLKEPTAQSARCRRFPGQLCPVDCAPMLFTCFAQGRKVSRIRAASRKE